MSVILHGVVEIGYKKWVYPVLREGEKVIINKVMYQVREVVHNYDTEVIHVYLKTV